MWSEERPEVCSPSREDVSSGRLLVGWYQHKISVIQEKRC